MKNHQFAQSFPLKHILSKTSSCNKAKSSCHAESAARDCKPMCCSSTKTDIYCKSLQKVRRLKTRKERNQIRGQERNRPRPFPQQSRKEVGEKAPRHHHIHPMTCARKDRAFAKPFIPQKPSIITEGRLTSIKGLFSHEVRSIDIERLVSEQIKENQRKQSERRIKSPLPPSVPDLEQDCTFSDVQEPENHTPPQVKRKSSRKELTGSTCDFHANREVTPPIESSRVDGKQDRHANTKKEDTKAKSKAEQRKCQCSPKEPEHLVLLPSENELVHQLCSTPGETNQNNSDVSQTDTFKSHDEGNHNQRSTMVGFPSKEVQPMLENGKTSRIAHNVRHGEQMSVSCNEAVKRLAKRLCQASELHVPSHRRPLLAECREVLMQALQKRHSFQLEHNLHRLHSSLKGKQTQLSSVQRPEDCSPFSHPVGNEGMCYGRKSKIWTDSVMQHDYLSEDIKRNFDRGASTKKRRIQEWKTSPQPFFLKEPLQSHTDMDCMHVNLIGQSLEFDQWRASKLSQDCFRAQHHPCGQLFDQDQILVQHSAPTLRAPTCVDHPVNPYSQQQSLSRDFDLSRMFQQLREDTDLNFNPYQMYDCRKQRPHEASFEGSSFWSHQHQVQGEREKLAPVSFSTSYLSEGFQYEPFRCPQPSDAQTSLDCLGSMIVCPRSNTPFYPPLYL